MSCLKNIRQEVVLPLAEEITVCPGQVVSKTLAQNSAFSITLFSFDRGEEIGSHDSEGDAMVQVLEGMGLFTVGENVFRVYAGETLVMPAKIKHSVHAEESFKMLLTVVFPDAAKGESK